MGTFYFAGILFAEPLIEALKKVGKNLSTEATLKALNSIKDFQGIGPKVTWTEKEHQGTDSVMIKMRAQRHAYNPAGLGIK